MAVMRTYSKKESRKNLEKAVEAIRELEAEQARREWEAWKLRVDAAFDGSDNFKEQQERNREAYFQEQFNIAMGLDG